jgi:thiopurine S-methyltransferase
LDAGFWHSRWEKGEIGFHEGQVNALLERHIQTLNLAKGQTIFLPLCGKTRDIAWVLSQGFNVVGAELNESAVQQLFAELGVEPIITNEAPFIKYQCDELSVYVGDIFSLTDNQLGRVDAVYDRAALVALPEPMRTRYTQHLVAITHTSPQLLITFDYQSEVEIGPPFAIGFELVSTYYQPAYEVKLLEQKPVESGVKGLPANENAFLLKPR